MVNIYVMDSNRVDIDAILKLPLFTSEDIDSFNKYKDEQVRKEKIVSTYLKRNVIGEYHLGERGKPLSDKIHFNVSHSHGLVMLALSKDYPIGIDLELVRKVNPKLLDSVTNNEEKEFIKCDKDFYKIWTSKESLLKACGSGINKRLEQVPGLPLDGVRTYENKRYVSQTREYGEYVFTVTLEKYPLDGFGIIYIRNVE